MRVELTEAVTAFLGSGPHGLFINGAFVPPTDGAVLEAINPSTGLSITQLAKGAASDVDRAVLAARRAFEGEWSRWSPYDRQALLHRIHDLLERDFEEFAQIESLDMGAPISRTRALKVPVQKMVLFFAAQAMSIAGQTSQNGLPGEVVTLSFREPAGVIGGIIAWNGPLISQWWILGAALATGCTVVLKPAEDASLSVIRMMRLLEEAGLPPGVVNVVTGHGSVVGDALARHPDVDRIAFTGSTQTGRKIIEASAGNIKRLQLELGGKSPDIIMADADLDRAVPGASMGVFGNSGQICYAGTRVFVQRPIVEEFTARAAEYSRTIAVGDGLDPGAHLGPVISASQHQKVLSYIEIGQQEGARLVAGGGRGAGTPDGGFYVEPTIFSGVSNQMRIAREEIFGPVLSIIPFDTVEEAIALANDTEYGLGGAVWSRDISSALRVVKRVRTGTMWVNCYGLIDPMLGFGGIRHSGYGMKGSHAHLDSYLTTKSVYINI